MNGHGTFCGRRTEFTLDGVVKTVVYGVMHVLMLCMSVLHIQVTLLYGEVLQLILFLVFFSLRRIVLKVLKEFSLFWPF